MQNNLKVEYSELLKNLSITAFNSMQEDVIEKATSLDNLMVLSPTGSGKTIPFLIAILNRLDAATKGVQAIVVSPSRELVLQIEQVFKSMKTSYKVSCCYGGHAMKIEQNSLSEAPALVIATPGRLVDHIQRDSLDLSAVKIVVLDEFDMSLQMGFHEQIRVLFNTLRGKQQHILTSATALEKLPDFLPFKNIETLDFLHQEIESKLQLKLVRTKTADKPETLMRLVAGFNQEVCLVFCNHRDAVERISKLFTLHKFEHGTFHGAMEQIDREKNLLKFRGEAHNVLIATDLAARGLDIPAIKHVVHYQLPPKEDSFIHRNGRTARMQADGEAYLILAEEESLPGYLNKPLEEIVLTPTLKLPPPPKFVCLYISAGKKDKISKGDIAGLLIKKGGLSGDDVGLITSLDHASFVSVNRSQARKVIEKLKNERIKKLKVKIEIAS